jgi:hypothetical protein
MAEKPEFVLFAVTGDKFCSNFITKLKSKPELIKKFNIVDIDTVPAIPDEVDEVPCVYDGKQLYKGKHAFTWLNEKMTDFLEAANDGLYYSFLDGQDEQVFGMYSLLEQKNGSYGMGPDGPNNDPTRMTALTDNTNKNRTLENLMNSRNQDSDISIPGGVKQNLNKV